MDPFWGLLCPPCIPRSLATLLTGMSFPDNTFATVHLPATNSASAQTSLRRMEQWNNIESCSLSNRLMLNDDKSEALLGGSTSAGSTCTIGSVCVGDADLPVSDSVRKLVVFIDSELSMAHHTDSVGQTSFTFSNF